MRKVFKRLRQIIKKMKIIADNKIPYLEGVFEPFCDVVYMSGNEIDRKSVGDADVLITRTRTKCNQELLEESNIKFIATATIGYDHIDTEYCAKKGIRWTNAPGCNSGSVQQWFMSALLHYAKQNSIDLTKRVLGIIGEGNVGSKILHFADSLGMRVVINDPPKARMHGACGYNNLDTILSECDIVTFHVPLNLAGADKTFHMADDKFFSKLNDGCLLFNSSRGKVIDESALLKYVKSGKNEGVILDVWEQEPQINTELLERAAIATPHIAGYSADGKANGTTMSVQAVSMFLGLPLENWSPQEVPLPENTILTIDAKKKSRQSVLTEAILQTYNILNDDSDLRGNIGGFEKLRGSYPLRREPNAYTINLFNDNRNYKITLEKLGFNVVLK